MKNPYRIWRIYICSNVVFLESLVLIRPARCLCLHCWLTTYRQILTSTCFLIHSNYQKRRIFFNCFKNSAMPPLMIKKWLWTLKRLIEEWIMDNSQIRIYSNTIVSHVTKVGRQTDLRSWNRFCETAEL